MIELANFQFLNPLWLVLLPLLWWLVWTYSRYPRRQSMWRRICDRALLDRMLVDAPGSNRNDRLAWILAIILTIGTLSAAGPSWRKQSYPMLESTSARVLALDLSRSMLTEDVRPQRLAHAVAAAKEIISADFDGETGLVVFAGAAFVVSPLSTDSATLLAFIDALDPGTMPEDGTRIDLAIRSARDLLAASVAGRGQIIIVTAGASDNDAALAAALTAANEGHRIHVLAIGTSAGGPALDAEGSLLRDTQGKVVLSKTNFALLDRVARAGKGGLVTMTGSSGVSDLLMSRLSANQLIESDRADDSSDRAAANDGAWLVLLMLPLALLLFRKNLIWMILLGILVPGDDELYAKEWNFFWNHPEQLAFEAYQQGDFKTSYELSTNPLLQGSAYYQSGQYQQALEMYSKDESAQSIYNLGNTLVQQHQFAEAVLAYQKALELNPQLDPARYNKRLIELYLEQQYETVNGQSGETDAGESSGDADLPDAEARIGVAGQELTNPADDQQSGPGLGASMQAGQVDPFERFDGLEQEMERFALQALDAGQLPDAEQAERWINALPETSTDLFRRKFLRDFQRQKRQPR
jgi:Ca-activated chloride channel family protein